MPETKTPRSEGDTTLRRRSVRINRSVGSPSGSTGSQRPTSVVDRFRDTNRPSFPLSPLNKSVLTDNTEIVEPRRKSWWKTLDNVKNDYDIMDNEIPVAADNVIDELDVEVLSQEKKVDSIDLPDSSGSESINSIIVPQRRLLTQKENQPQNKYGQVIGTRDSLPKHNKTNFQDKTVNVGTKNLFNNGVKRSKPVFPSALLDISLDKTIANKTKEIVTEVKGQARNLFGMQAMKRKNKFANFIVSDSEDDISDIQPKRFGFDKGKEPTVAVPGSSAGFRARKSSRGSSIGSSVSADVDDWQLLPSSTLIENEIDTALTPKRTRLSRVSLRRDQSTKHIASNKDTTNSEPENVPETSHDNLTRDQFVDLNETSHNRLVNKTQAEPTLINAEIETDNQHKQSVLIETHTQDIVDTKHDYDDDENITLTYDDSDKDEENDQVPDRELEFEKNKSSKPLEEKDTTVVANTEAANIDNLEEIMQDNKINTSFVMQNITAEKAQEMEIYTPETLQVEELLEGNNKNDRKTSGDLKDLIQCDQVTDKTHDDVQLVAINQSNVSKCGKNLNLSNKTTPRQETKEAEVVAHQEVRKIINQTPDQISTENVENDNQEEQEASKNGFVNTDSQNVIQNKIAYDKNEIEVNHQEERVVLKPTESNDVLRDEIKDNDHKEIVKSDQTKLEVNERKEDSQKADILEDIEEIEACNQNKEDRVLEYHIEKASDKEEKESDNQVKIVTEGVKEKTSDEQEENNVDEDQEDDEVEGIDEIEVECQEESTSHQYSKVKEVESKDEIEDECQEESARDETEIEKSIQEEIEDDDEYEEVIEEEEIEIEIDEDDQNESACGEMETDQSDEEIDGQDEEEVHIENEEIDVSQEMDGEQNVSEPDQEAGNENKHQNYVATDDVANSTHDTTGRNRNKNMERQSRTQSPEVVLHNKSSENNSFNVRGRNTSIRKSAILKSMNLNPSLGARESFNFTDGSKNSSAEGSGWDSHRTTRKTLRQTFGKDFSPRKSIRTLVMEHEAKRRTMIKDANAELGLQQANSTEIPMDDVDMYHYDDENAGHSGNDSSEQESIHEISLRTRQANLERALQQKMEEHKSRVEKIKADVVNSFKPIPARVDVFKLPAIPQARKPIMKSLQTTSNKKNIKRTNMPLQNLPPELLKTMKYKPPKRFQPSSASWITNRLYSFLEKKLEPKYDYKARLRAEMLVESIYAFTKDVRRVKVASPHAVNELKREMARLNVVTSHFDFYEFFQVFMPLEVKNKVVPDIVNNIPLPRNGIFSEILTQ